MKCWRVQVSETQGQTAPSVQHDPKPERTVEPIQKVQPIIEAVTPMQGQKARPADSLARVGKSVKSAVSKVSPFSRVFHFLTLSNMSR